jgi:hypothetical protein
MKVSSLVYSYKIWNTARRSLMPSKSVRLYAVGCSCDTRLRHRRILRLSDTGTQREPNDPDSGENCFSTWTLGTTNRLSRTMSLSITAFSNSRAASPSPRRRKPCWILSSSMCFCRMSTTLTLGHAVRKASSSTSAQDRGS